MISSKQILSVMTQLEEARKKKSPCLKKDRQIAAALASKGNRLIIATNTPPTPKLVCSKCRRENNLPGEDSYNCPALHAEVKCIVTGLNYRYPMIESSLVTTHFPCIHCAMLAVYAGIKKVYYRYEYYEEEKKDIVIGFLNEADVEIYKI